MTLDELEADMKRREDKKKDTCPSNNNIANQSFQCNNQNHSDCKWTDCKCMCHDVDYNMAGWGM